jgi:hypothetical protein
MSTDVAEWLNGLGLERYEPAFRENEIDREALPKLTAEASNFAGDSAKAEGSAGQHAHPHRAFRLVNQCVSAQS